MKRIKSDKDIGLLIFLAVSSLVFLLNEPRLRNGFAKIFEYQISTDQQKIFSDRLPAHGVLGYLTEKKSSDIFYDVEASKLYYMTQYRLAPRVIDNNTKHQFVIGNFKKKKKKNDLKGYQLVEKGAYGLVLLERHN